MVAFCACCAGGHDLLSWGSSAALAIEVPISRQRITVPPARLNEPMNKGPVPASLASWRSPCRCASGQLPRRRLVEAGQQHREFVRHARGLQERCPASVPIARRYGPGWVGAAAAWIMLRPMITAYQPGLAPWSGQFQQACIGRIGPEVSARPQRGERSAARHRPQPSHTARNTLPRARHRPHAHPPCPSAPRSAPQGGHTSNKYRAGRFYSGR